jgi:hypothetical protein
MRSGLMPPEEDLGHVGQVVSHERLAAAERDPQHARGQARGDAIDLGNGQLARQRLVELIAVEAMRALRVAARGDEKGELQRQAVGQERPLEPGYVPKPVSRRRHA